MLSILTITGPIFILIGLGFGAVRGKVLSKPDMRPLSLFVLHFAVPAVVFRTVSSRPVYEVFNPGFIAAYTLGSLAVFFFGLFIARAVLKKDLSTAAIMGLGVSLSNSAFIGYPVAAGVLGEQAASILVQCMIVENVLMMPLALALAEAGSGKNRRWIAMLSDTAQRLARNPIIIAMLLGAIVSMVGFDLPEPITVSVNMLASVAAPAALFVIGGTLVGLPLKGMAGDVSKIVSGKLLLHPLLVFTALWFMPGIPNEMMIAGVLFASVPMLSIYPILGLRYGLDALCATSMLVATVAAFFTISALIFVLTMIGATAQ
ncbi:AEC family transporter [Pelagibacterium lentulum]|uniref:Malonate transporter n=1 Tax=Pelagibacterium lentulum TaxID=2029865 RepID=A0A916RCF5_9HYPH|nr:AEC family transporter [Pelagibacterium lentulum]GGA49731.1 malonate transporter [Pelagibacterium lentulum]